MVAGGDAAEAAAKLKGDQNRLAAAKQFAAWTAVLDEPATPLEELEGTAGLADHSVVVAISSDKGLCGGVHSAVARGLRTINARLKEENKTMNVIAVGEKGRSQLRRMVPDSLPAALTNIPPPYNFGYASTVAQMALDTEPEKTGAIAVVYNKFVSAIAYSPTLKTIAPFVLEGDDVTLTAYDADDDVRDAPALEVAQRLHDEGARVVVVDPQALDNARRAHPDLEYAGSALEAAAAEGCRAVLVARIAGGLYAGRHARDVQNAYRHIVDEVLCEEMGATTVPRGRFFEEVTIVDLGTGWRPAR